MPRERRATHAARLLPSVLAALAAAAPAAVHAAPPAIRLVVRGDDMGSSQASNEAAIRCSRDGVMRDVEVMAVGPWFPQAARLLRENPGLDVGLHLALTSEWDAVKWRPLTPAPSLVGRDAYFHPMVWPHPHYGKERALREQPWKLDEIERELRAQIELTRREVPQLSHLSDHMGFTSLGSEVAALVKRLAVEYGLDIDPEALGARTVGWYGKPEAPADKVTSFTRLVEELGPGTWIFVDHPALDTPELRATGHVGYEQVAVDRQGVTDAWTSAAVKEIVRRRGIELVGYRDLARAAAPDGEARVVEYLRAHVKPGQPVVVSELYNTVFTAPEERAALDRLFNTFFKMPLYMAQHQKAAGKPPSLAEISEQFRFPVPGEADVMLRVMESDPRMPRFIARDPATGEITRVDVEAILAHPRFGRALERTIAGWEGRPAPPFSAATYDDQPLTSESLAGTPHLLYFWFTGCPPCVRTSPLLAELHRAHAARGFRIVALNADRTLELPYADVDRTAYATAQGWEFTLAHMTPETQEAHGAVSVFPTMFFVDRRGTVVKHLVNFQDKATLEEAVEAAMR